MPGDLDEVTEEVLGASRALVAIAVQSLSEHAADLTMVQYRCLVVLAMQGATGTTELADQVGVHQSTVTRATDQLVCRGLAVKQRDEVDRRRTLVVVSDAGQEVINAVMSARRSIIRDVLGRMSPREVTRTGSALAAFTAAAEPTGADGRTPRHTL